MKNGLLHGMKAFLFDLDGTLIDSKLDIVNSVNAMLRKTGRTELPLEMVASYVGHGAPQLMASVLGPDASESDREAALQIFLQHYEDHKLDATRLYPGTAEGLHLLHDGGADQQTAQDQRADPGGLGYRQPFSGDLRWRQFYDQEAGSSGRAGNFAGTAGGAGRGGDGRGFRRGHSDRAQRRDGGSGSELRIRAA